MLVVDMSGSPAMALGPLLTDIPNTANIEVSIYTYLMAIMIRYIITFMMSTKFYARPNHPHPSGWVNRLLLRL